MASNRRRRAKSGVMVTFDLFRNVCAIVSSIDFVAKDLSGEKTRRYAVNYPKTVQAIAEMVIE